jgi:hypothetical protein
VGKTQQRPAGKTQLLTGKTQQWREKHNYWQGKHKTIGGKNTVVNLTIGLTIDRGLLWSAFSDVGNFFTEIVTPQAVAAD